MVWSTFWRSRKIVTNLPKLSCGFKTQIDGTPHYLLLISFNYELMKIYMYTNAGTKSYHLDYIFMQYYFYAPYFSYILKSIHLYVTPIFWNSILFLNKDNLHELSLHRLLNFICMLISFFCNSFSWSAHSISFPFCSVERHAQFNIPNEHPKCILN